MQAYEITQRLFTRAEELILRTAATPPTDQVALKALAPDMVRECQAFKVTDSSVKAAERGAAKEVQEALDAMNPLRKFYDEARQVVMAAGEAAPCR